PLGEVSGSGWPILTTERIVLPRLSPQGASGKLATFLRQSFLHQAARSLHPGRFSLAPDWRGLAVCVGARLDAVASRLENQLTGLPAKPGVYLFRDKSGEVLYVGKAK